MAIIRQPVPYAFGGVAFEALAVWDDARRGPRPGVLVTPTFMDRSAFEEERAARLAGLGYVGLAVDLYGVAHRPASAEAARAAMAALDGDRATLAARMGEALARLRALDAVDPARTAAIGFCFGGKAVLDLARAGSDVLGVAALHGLFDPPPHATAPAVAARVLALHGWDDPLATPDAVLALARELDAKGADWEIDAYSGTGHGFTNPARAEMYRARADRRSWARLTGFLEELFAA